MKKENHLVVRGKIASISQRGLDGKVETDITLLPFKNDNSNVLCI